MKIRPTKESPVIQKSSPEDSSRLWWKGLVEKAAYVLSRRGERVGDGWVAKGGNENTELTR